MSLAQHVTQAEGFDYERPFLPDQSLPADTAERGIGSDKSKWRPLSYGVTEQTDQVPQEGPIAAYEVSRARRLEQVIAGTVACGLAAGIIFGFAAIKPVLVAEGVYSDLCKPGDPAAKWYEKAEGHVPCTAQDLRLNLFYIVGSVTANVGTLITGTILDRAGRRVCWIASSGFLILGSLLMASASRLPLIDWYLVGNAFLALGGAFVLVSSFQLANTFPKHKGLIIALISGAFDASAAVFLIYRVIYEATGYSLSKFFITYITVPVLILAAEIIFMPAGPYDTTPQLQQKIDWAHDEIRDVHESDDDISDSRELTRVRSKRADERAAELHMIEDVTGDADEREERTKLDEETREISGVWGVLHGVSAHLQIRSPWFILILVLTSIQMMRMNYFIATIHGQYRYMLGSDQDADDINRFFDVALPVGGLVATPFIGLMLNNLSVSKTFGVLTLVIIALGVFNCLPYAWAGYTTVVIFVIFRPFYYSAMSDYATKVFGFATFGRIYGTLNCVSGLTSFAQSGLDVLTHGLLHGDPTPINIAFLVAGALAGIYLTAFVAVKGRAFVAGEKSYVENATAAERQRLLPGRDGT